MTNQILLIQGRKEVKNQNLVKNLMSAFEDRFISIVNLKDSGVKEAKDSFHLVVFSQVTP